MASESESFTALCLANTACTRFSTQYGDTCCSWKFPRRLHGSDAASVPANPFSELCPMFLFELEFDLYKAQIQEQT
jgi:hypothetical protein